MYTGIKKIFQTARTESVDLGYNDISEHYLKMAILLQLDSRSTSCRYVRPLYFALGHYTSLLGDWRLFTRDGSYSRPTI